MKRNQKIKVKFDITAEVPFSSTGVEKVDNKIKKHIRRWIKEILEDEATYIPLIAEGENGGIIVDDISGKSKFIIKEIKKCQKKIQK